MKLLVSRAVFTLFRLEANGISMGYMDPGETPIQMTINKSVGLDVMVVKLESRSATVNLTEEIQEKQTFGCGRTTGCVVGHL